MEKIEQKTEITEKVYDLIFSLGGSCAATTNMRRNDLQIRTLPFDWFYYTEKAHLNRMTELFKNDFKDFFQFKNLVFSPDEENAMLCFDKFTLFYAKHDFKQNKNIIYQYWKFKRKMKRRLNRLKTLIKSADNILIVDDNDIYHSEDDIKSFLAGIRSKYNDKNIDFISVCYRENESEIIEENIDSGAKRIIFDRKMAECGCIGNPEGWAKVFSGVKLSEIGNKRRVSFFRRLLEK